MEMQQSYWAGIHDNLADGIQFVENHAGLTESIKGFRSVLLRRDVDFLVF